MNLIELLLTLEVIVKVACLGVHFCFAHVQLEKKKLACTFHSSSCRLFWAGVNYLCCIVLLLVDLRINAQMISRADGACFDVAICAWSNFDRLDQALIRSRYELNWSSLLVLGHLELFDNLSQLRVRSRRVDDLGIKCAFRSAWSVARRFRIHATWKQ